MFPVARSGGLRISFCWRCRRGAAFSSSSVATTSHPNPPLNLDPSLKAFLKDVDISLAHTRTRPLPPRKELDAIPVEPKLAEDALAEEDVQDEYSQRKSPAAHFGSQQIGAVIIPSELQNSINVMISGAGYASCHRAYINLWFRVESSPAAQ
jgi:hypothetical protein